MLQKLNESSGSVIGYRAVGKITAADYNKMEPEVQALVEKYDSISLLIDLQKFAGEDIRAWLPDLEFGHRFGDRIEKMAIVGDKEWQRWLTKLAGVFYAKDAKYFPAASIGDAWDWLA